MFNVLIILWLLTLSLLVLSLMTSLNEIKEKMISIFGLGDNDKYERRY